ncbi:CRISPR-associated protein Cas4 [Coraliomargarita sp. W4R72]
MQSSHLIKIKLSPQVCPPQPSSLIITPLTVVALSALQHYLYCPRQCALIHVERLWAENFSTAEGNALHEKAHSGLGESRPGVRISRGLPVWSDAHGLRGVCDIVEIHQDGSLIPVEYKRGRPKAHRADEIQLCGQAICLETSFEREPNSIQSGYLFYGKQQRRIAVTFDAELRALTLNIAAKVRAMIEAGQILLKDYSPTLCDRCSMIHLCQPKSMRLKRGVDYWFQQRITEQTAET